ncbi:importin subunit alpha [Striga asiatica]|uniref:Importin subunit alpha n=1 Tax=Striga asiatica TaxID=4170 RepID=A0A5A7Q0G6_STRAF|nr:importin subunit alpha [Striga asiatica]
MKVDRANLMSCWLSITRLERNIVGCSPTYRYVVLSQEALSGGIDTVKRVGANLNLHSIKVPLALPVPQILVYSDDQQVLSCACWALNPLPSVQMAATRTVRKIAGVDAQSSDIKMEVVQAVQSELKSKLKLDNNYRTEGVLKIGRQFESHSYTDGGMLYVEAQDGLEMMPKSHHSLCGT